MTDAFHHFGSDLAVSANGDLLTASGADESRQRVLRRLLTNPADYLWQPEYGAGLPASVGRPLDAAPLTALVAGQMYLEADVAREPHVALTPIPDGVSARIAYTSVESGEPVLLGFDVTP